MVYLIEGYYFLVATVFVANSKAEFIYLNRRFLLGAMLLGTGIFFGSFFYSIGEMVGVIAGIVFAVMGLIPVFQKIMHKSETIEVINIPKDSYEIRSFEEGWGKYLLTYQGQTYILTTIPSKDKPALKMYVSRLKNTDQPVATIIEKDKKLKWPDVYGIVLYIIAVFLPVVLYFLKDQPDAFEMMLGACLGILIFHGSYVATYHSKEGFGKFFHNFSLAMSIILWVAAIVNIIQLLF